MQEFTINMITTGYPAYEGVWDLREKVLRAPLGLSLKNEDLSMDDEDLIITANEGDTLAGCIMMRAIDEDTIKFRQMAVYPQWQLKGIGRLLLQAAEQEAVSRGYKQVILHARKVAVPFYEKTNYVAIGDVFDEIGIPHQLMTKQL